MGKVILLPETTKFPITLMGHRAGIARRSDTSDPEKNYKRGIHCLQSGHGRVMEYVNIEAILDGYSIGAMRDYYTHIAGAPTRLQDSTRGSNLDNFAYVDLPNLENNPKARKIYEDAMRYISTAYTAMKEAGADGDSTSSIIPLGMASIVVDKRNLRNFIEVCRQRLCGKARMECRVLCKDIIEQLITLSDEWKYLAEHYMLPKCVNLGYCNERKSCGYYSKHIANKDGEE